MRIGIFGSSFDPPHMGHFWVCKNAIESYELDKLFIVPNAKSPFKETKNVEAHHIYTMARVFAEEVGGIIDDQEMIRSEPSYTWDTILNFHGRFPNDDLCLVMGSDSLFTFQSWYRVEDIAETIHKVLVAVRSDLTGNQQVHLSHILPISKIWFIPSSFVAISSTELRLRLKSGKIITGLIPGSVLKYIENNKLYL
jgi:nicotinate-nucleotide adenylyltransferase